MSLSSLPPHALSELGDLVVLIPKLCPKDKGGRQAGDKGRHPHRGKKDPNPSGTGKREFSPTGLLLLY